jgi:hypothetical protein
MLAVACLAAFEAGCTSDGGVIGMAPDGSTTTSGRSNAGDDEVSDTTNAVVTGNFKPLINKGGVAACMSITEKDVPTNYWETVGLGAAVGTVLLAVLGAAAGVIITGGRADGAIYGAAAGAAAGAGLGAADGARTAEQKRNFAIQLARYDCQIQAAEMESVSLRDTSNRLSTSVATLGQQLDQLEQDYANKRMNRAQAQKELNDIDDNSAALKRRLVAMKESTGKYEQFSASTESLAKGTDMAIDLARKASLESQIEEMDRRTDDLEQEYAALVERRKALVLQ